MIEHGVSVIRADVAGRADGMVSYGSSGIVDSRGRGLQSTQPLTEDLIVADLEVSLRPFGRSPEREEAVIRARFGIYQALQ